MAVFSIADPVEGKFYADLARALAADCYNIYVVDMDTKKFIEYTSRRLGRTGHGTPRHGFFAAVKQDTMTRICADNLGVFLNWFSKENIIQTLEDHGAFTAYRLIDTGIPMQAFLKITRLQGTNRIIAGVSVADSQKRK